MSATATADQKACASPQFSSVIVIVAFSFRGMLRSLASAHGRLDVCVAPRVTACAARSARSGHSSPSAGGYRVHARRCHRPWLSLIFTMVCTSNVHVDFLSSPRIGSSVAFFNLTMDILTLVHNNPLSISTGSRCCVAPRRIVSRVFSK